MALAPWLLPTDFLSAMREGAGLGLQIRAQNERRDQEAAANALQQQSLLQQAQQAQQHAAVQFADQQTRRQDTLGQLAQQQAFHQDTLAQQDIANKRADAAQVLRDKAQALAEDRANKMFEIQTAAQNRLSDLGERKLTLEEQKLNSTKPSVSEQNRQAKLAAAKAEFRNTYGALTPEDETTIEDAVIGNQYKNPTSKDTSTLQDNATMAQVSGDISNKIKAFNAKYGPDEFTKKYAGQFDNGWEQLKKKWLDRDSKGISQEDADAYAITQDYLSLFDPRVKSMGGGRVAPETIERLKGEVANMNSKNFVNEIENFRRRRAQDLVSYVDANKGTVRIPARYVRQAHALNSEYAPLKWTEKPIVYGGEVAAPEIAPDIPNPADASPGLKVGKYRVTVIP